MSEQIQLHAADGHMLGAYVAEPDGTPRAAIVVIQEAFGVNAWVRSVVDGYAAEGYLAIAPALYDRYERNFEVGYTPAEMQRGVAVYQQVDHDAAVADIRAAVEYARDEYKTRVGVVGFCMGGMLAWLAATRLPVSAAVGYYGGRTVQYKEEQPVAPVMLHFGREDSHIPLADVEAIQAAHPEIPVHLYDGAAHGFACSQRGSYAPEAAEMANSRTRAFFAANLSA